MNFMSFAVKFNHRHKEKKQFRLICSIFSIFERSAKTTACRDSKAYRNTLAIAAGYCLPVSPAIAKRRKACYNKRKGWHVVSRSTT
jgi:hypothetical protein